MPRLAMTVENRGKEAAVGKLPGMAPGSVAAIESSLTALVDRMEAEVGDGGSITTASASELRRIRREAERLFQNFEHPTRPA